MFGAAILAGALVFSGAAQAAPLGLAKSAAMAFETDILSVRDGCGRGMRFSNRRQACVVDRDSRHFDDRRHDDRRRSHRNDNDAAAAIATGAVILGIIAAGSNKNKNHGQVKVHSSSKPHKKKN